MTDIYFDGGCKPNPGMMEVAIVIVRDGAEQAYHERLDHGTNNQAEWLALLWAMMEAEKAGIDEITLKGDSQLVINQAKGAWKVKDPSMKYFHDEFQERRAKFRRVGLQYVPRAQNLAGIHIEEVNG